MEDWLKEANTEIDLEVQNTFEMLQVLSERLSIEPEYVVEYFIKRLRRVAIKELLQK